MSAGIVSGLAAAVLFGAATPAAKVLLGALSSFQVAGLLYVGAAIGIAPFAALGRRERHSMDAGTRRRLAGSILFGGIAGPVLLMLGLRTMAAGSVSLLLNAEIAATTVLGVVLFGETLGSRGWAGVAGVAAAGIALSSQGGWPGATAATLVVAACVCWGIDNNLTALIDGMSPSETTLWKTAIAGATNIAIGLLVEPSTAPLPTIAMALVVGALCYGMSIALYITAAQQAGAVRAQALFAVAPFVGALLSWGVLREPVGGAHLVAAALLVGSIVLLMSDSHSHAHRHGPMRHVHTHRHDDGHHDHGHVAGDPAGDRHSHWHEHAATEHAHPHVADLHHRH